MAPLFSIITPSFNPGAKLAASFDSVMAQEPGLFEYVVSDGASNDGTREWLENHGGSNLKWISEKDSGVYDGMNKGIHLSTGSFLLFLGAGDLLVPGVLKRASEFIAKQTEGQPRMIYGDVRDMQTGKPFTQGRYTRNRMCHGNICHQGIFYERGIFDRLGTYELRYPIMADWAFNLKCFGDCGIRKIHFPETVADFEGAGLCSHTGDHAFANDRRQLIKERLGPIHAFRYRVESALLWRFRKLGLPL